MQRMLSEMVVKAGCQAGFLTVIWICNAACQQGAEKGFMISLSS
jgi:hypothetical protein